MSHEEMQAAAQEIARTLGETEPKPCSQIAALVQHCGIDFAQALLEETRAIEARGGMMLPDQSRRRTLGGIFFYLVRRRIPTEMAHVIFPRYDGDQTARKKNKEKPHPSDQSAFQWTKREPILQRLLNQQGVLTTVKVTLIGRPGQVDYAHKDLVITTMSHVAKSTSMPKGVPQPPDTPTLYTIYISSKQWRRVEATLVNPDDALIIEGTCAYDDQISGMAVFATNVTSKHLEAQKRQGQKKATDATTTTGAVTSAKPINVFESASPPATAVPNLPNVPTEALNKLTELYASASLFRQKITTIQSKPAGQQFGLEMTQKLLKNVEDEIAALEAKYQD
jgi:hypothetical protein